MLGLHRAVVWLPARYTLKKYCAALLKVGIPVNMLRLRRSETLSISSFTSWKGSTGPKLCTWLILQSLHFSPYIRRT